MGTWGVGPFDNDRAGDFVASLMKPIHRVVDAKKDDTARYLYDEARVRIQLVALAHGTDILGGPTIGVLVQALARMRCDVEWLSGWKSPRKIASALDKEIDGVINVMLACKRCRTNGSLKESLPIAEAAKLVAVPRSVRRKKLPRRTTRARVKRRRA